MGNVDFLHQWWEIAVMDLDTADHLAKNMWPTPYPIICYQTQQAVEKYFKGFLALHGQEPPRLHDLTELCKLCEAIKPEFASLNDICSDLTPYGTQPRYPAELRLEKEDADRALAKAHQVKDFMKTILPEIC